jgi:L-arabinose isomerase
VAEGEILGDLLAGARSIAGYFRFAGDDLHASYTRWLQAGPVHHASCTPGHIAGDLADVAHHLNMEFVGVTG